MDPQLQWTGKNEKAQFEIDLVSLNVHERIDPLTIMEKVLQTTNQQTLSMFFTLNANNFPLSKAVEFYKHKHDWSNRLIAGDSLLVMNSLLEKEGLGGKIQMVYIDPPYGIKYASNFQPFVSKQGVKDVDDDLTQEPEMIKAYRDTWELGIHSYLTYLRDRLLLAKQLMTDEGSCFVQISIENIHLVRNLMDEIFGKENFMNIITYRTKQGVGAKYLPRTSDYIVWYANDIKKVKFNQLYVDKNYGTGTMYTHLELPNKEIVKMNEREMTGQVKIREGARIFRHVVLVSPGKSKSGNYKVKMDESVFTPGENKHWRTTEEGMNELIKWERVRVVGNTLQYIMYYDDLPIQELTNVWTDTQGASDKKYVVQTSEKIIQRCMMMVTEPGDLVFDPTCGSGTTAYVAEKFGRRWITCDTSRISIAVARQRIMTSIFDYYKLSDNATSGNDISAGFMYKEVTHKTLEQIAQNKPTGSERLVDRPIIDESKYRISGPFTVEAVPAPTIKSIDALYEKYSNTYNGEGKLIREHNMHNVQQKWRDELLNAGVRGKGNQKIKFEFLNTHPTTRWIHAIGETKEDNPHHVAVSFGPEHVPLEQRQVSLALDEARKIVPEINMVVFAAMHFDPEASKNIDEICWEGVSVLKVEINKDLLTHDLKKNRDTNESFWIIGQPDVTLDRKGDDYTARINGFDYFDTEKDEIVSSDAKKVVLWMIDTDYDGRSVYPQQMFFPMKNSVGDRGLRSLEKTLQSEIDSELFKKFYSLESLPFKAGNNLRAAVKIIDDRGIESLKILELG